MKRVPLRDIGLALKCAEFRNDFDALLARHDAKINFAWEGKRALLSVVFNEVPDRQMYLVECRKDRGARYLSQVEETL